MYAIEKGIQKINGGVVETFQRVVFCGDTEIEVEVGTTGYKGDRCSTAGARTFLSFLCVSGNFHFSPIEDDEGHILGINIACCGDEGLSSVIKALDFAREAINDQMFNVDD